MKDYKSSRVPDATSKWLRARVKLLGALFFLLLGVVVARAFKLQVIDRASLTDLARDQYVRSIHIPAKRGDLLDRRGVPLAQSVDVDSIWIDPSMLQDPAKTAKDLARVLKLDAADLADRFARGRRFAWVKRHVKPAEVEAVRKLGIDSALGLTKEPKRFYPQRELAAQVIGVVGTDGNGLEGLELAFNDELTGQGSKLQGFRDAKGRKLLTQGGVGELERQGASVELTLDGQIQFVAERALQQAVIESKAPAGMAVVMNPRTGELLALANYPRFNPNTPKQLPRATLRNRAVLDLFEPGSIFKAFLVAAALEEGAIKQDDIFFCENGAWQVGGHTINDTSPHGWLTPEKVLQVSSNICAGKIAQKLGREKLQEYYRRFGFGERAGLGLPSEGKGSLPFPRAEVGLITQSFGQGLTATALQMAAGFSALANDGQLMRPYLVSRVVDPDGLVLLENSPTPVRQVVAPKTARKVISMLETVVQPGGTARRARMDEWRVAGKTGTAQKADPVARGYSDKRIASFIGTVPAEDPRLVILVVIDEPKTDVYGGIVAAPAFKEIAQAALPYLGVPPSRGGELKVAEAPIERRPANDKPAPVVAALTENPVLGAMAGGQAGKGSVVVPDLSGKVGREAVSSLLAVALEPRLVGSGRVTAQVPVPGSRVPRGAKVTVELEARP